AYFRWEERRTLRDHREVRRRRQSTRRKAALHSPAQVREKPCACWSRAPPGWRHDQQMARKPLELSRHDVLSGRSGVGSLIADISSRLGQPQHNPPQLTLANAAETARQKWPTG